MKAVGNDQVLSVRKLLCNQRAARGGRQHVEAAVDHQGRRLGKMFGGWNRLSHRIGWV
jgi:hypothetical protein